MRYICFLIAMVWAACATAQTWEDQQIFGNPDAKDVVRILSSTDTALFEDVLNGFVAASPERSVAYFVTATANIDTIVRGKSADFDVVISSAMDLQFKLANDGFALQVQNLGHPKWAAWRNSLFAFTSEPAAIVINRAAFANGAVPRTRQALIRALRDRPDDFRNRVGTYDVRQSGLGYFFATQDARTSETFWRLMEVMGNLETRLYCCSGDMIDDVANGRIAVAYNVLGSYAQARASMADKIEVILPEDFQTIMMRTALVPSDAPNPEGAQAFIAHLLGTLRLQAEIGSPSLPMLDTSRPFTEQSTISLEPALLTYLDRLKSQQFLAEWEDAVIQ